MASADGRQSEAVIEFAARLFAAFGYDGTYLQGIAEATGHDLAWMHDTFGDKRNLYLAVLERAAQAERAVAEDALAVFPTGDPAEIASAMYALVDRYLEFCLAHPQVPALWVHRWLGDAADIPDVEEKYAAPLIERTREALLSAARAGIIDNHVDLDLMVRTLIWSIYGLLYGEAVTQPEESPSADPETLRRYRAHLHQLVDRMLKLPGA
ncbi:TetR/AcrR family transcriptional regulator [Streptosporangium sp. NPDC006007]|uniref:TetR/AcrR family transcriptional regulator n=1 Tax=Streptosporangium sp. NPDC006007 TaxID=3154575 RepID=UPI0033A2FC3C